ncbi:MAG: hypothetical protein ACR2MA_02075 [Egibacteraceae bacterium]
MAAARRPRDPWQNAPTSELGDQVLPRWFVLLAIVMVIAAVVVLVIAFTRVGGGGYEQVAARRPPPGNGLTSQAQLRPEDRGVGLRHAGASCAPGLRVRGTATEIETLRSALAVLCQTELPESVRTGLGRLSERNARYAFGVLEPARVDVTRVLASTSPLIVVNSSLADASPSEFAPLFAYDAALAGRDPAAAAAVLRARRAEAAVCDRLLPAGETTLACADAEALTSLADPLGELRRAGFR